MGIPDMAKIVITEFERLARDADNNVMQAGMMPEAASQSVTYTTSTQSAALNSRTHLVRLVADATAHVAFGENPTATASSAKLASGVEYYFGVPEHRGSMKIAAYDGTS